MFTVPCATDDCAGDAADGRSTCDVCHDRNGFPAGWSRAKDEAWLQYKPCPEIALIPTEGPGCNGHPVTPLPDVCEPCTHRSYGVPEEQGTATLNPAIGEAA